MKVALGGIELSEKMRTLGPETFGVCYFMRCFGGRGGVVCFVLLCKQSSQEVY